MQFDFNPILKAVGPMGAFMKPERTALTRSTQAITPESLQRDLLEDTNTQPHRILWIDGVGGFLLVESDEVIVGQAAPRAKVDVAIVGDLSRQSAAIRRSEGDYLLQPLQATQLNGADIDRPHLLSHNDELQLGDRVKLQFMRPSPLSATAVLKMGSLNRFKPNVDGVLLLADSCILGPAATSHVQCPHWKGELLMFKKGDDWVFRTLETVTVNGEEAQGQILLTPGMRMQGEDFSLSVE
ncbi:MAG TPA: hypothetical protein DDW52_15910 [Planctomycetaceae bacterium]|nr:hypothetical protein [Planctomycetaceae bacterium]